MNERSSAATSRWRAKSTGTGSTTVLIDVLYRRHRRGADDRPFVDREVHDRRDEAERNRDDPDDGVRAGLVEQHAAQPHAEEASDLVAEEDEAAEHRHELDAE